MKSVSNFEREARTLEILLRFLGTKNALRNRVFVYDYIDKVEYVFSTILLEKFMSTTCSMIIEKTLNTPIIGDMFTEKVFEDLGCNKFDEIRFKYLKKADVNKNVIVTLIKKPNFWLNEEGLNILGEKLCGILHKTKIAHGNKKIIVMVPSKESFSDAEIKILSTTILSDGNITNKTRTHCGFVVTRWDVIGNRKIQLVIRRVN